MPIRSNAYRPLVPAYQANATLAQANPVSGTKYTVLATTANVRVINSFARVTWTVQPTPLEVHFTADSRAWAASITNPVSTTAYVADILDALNAASVYDRPRSMLFEARSCKIEAETTGGTTSNLSCEVKYGKW